MKQLKEFGTSGEIWKKTKIGSINLTQYNPSLWKTCDRQEIWNIYTLDKPSRSCTHFNRVR